MFEKILKRGEEFHVAHDYQKALDMYDLALIQRPHDPHVMYLLGTLYSEIGKSGLGIHLLEDALKYDVNEHTLNNLGICYRNTNQLDKALATYKQALAMEYSIHTLANLGGLYINNGTPEESLKWTAKALKLDPVFPHALNNYGLALLEQCKWKEGFDAYRHRKGLPQWSERTFGVPRVPDWDGKKVGKLVIHGEQGLGDEIMFMSCLPFVRSLADEIVIECATRLKELFEDSFGLPCYGTEKEVMESGFKPDAQVSMGSVPHLVNLADRWEERTFPYLKVTQEYPKEGFRIGISWRGGTDKTHAQLRNFDMALWKPIARLPVQVVSVQYGPAAGMAKTIGVPHDQAAIDDLRRLAGLLKSCDAIVTVCNSTVHMAGALDIPCYVLTPYKKAWRYCSDTERMKWYRSVVLIQQADGEDWASVVQRAKERVCADFPQLQRAEQEAARDAA